MKLLSTLSLIIEFVIGCFLIGAIPFLMASFLIQVFIRLFYSSYWKDLFILNFDNFEELDETQKRNTLLIYQAMLSILVLLCPLQLAYDISVKINKGESQ